MKLTEQLEHLQHTEDATAEHLMELYPPDWDMQRIFDRTYRQYQMQQQGTPIRGNYLRRIVQISSIAAVYAVLVVGAIWFAKLPPPDAIREHGVLETEASQPLTDQTEATASSQNAAEPDSFENDTQPASETQLEDTASTTPSATQAPSGQTDAPANIATLPNHEEHGETQAVQTTPAVTSKVEETAPPPAAGTEPMETTAPNEPTAPVTTEDQAYEPPPVNAVSPAPVQDGAFTITPGADGQFSTMTYIRSSEEPVTEHEHSFAAEGFMVVSEEIQNAELDHRSKKINVEDDAGQHYVVNIIGYAYFQTQFASDYYPDIRSMTISGRPAYLLAGASGDNMAILYWDDGCHISTMFSQVKDLNNMIRLAENLTNE